MSSSAIDAPFRSAAVRKSVTSVPLVVAAYTRHEDAEQAIRLLANDGLNIDAISIIGRNFEIREDVKGFFHPTDAMREGAGFGALWGGVFGLLAGAGMFVFPLVGPVLILGPLASLGASILGGAGLGVIAGSLAFIGIDPKDAIKYEEYIQAGEFLVVVHGATENELDRARMILSETNQTLLHSHLSASGGAL